MSPAPEAFTGVALGATTAQASVATRVVTMRRAAREEKVRTDVMAWEIHP